MADRSGTPILISRTPVATAGLVFSIWLAALGSGWPQATSPPSSAPLQQPAKPAAPDQPAAPPASAAAVPPREEKPGLLDDMGKVFEKSLSILPTLKSPSETIDDLNARARDAAKDAGDSLSRLTKPSSMVTGRVICPVAANGAPDCKAGADTLCQSKGFKQGNSLTFDSAEACSAKVLIPGRTRKPGDCRTDNYVTRALCQ